MRYARALLAGILLVCIASRAAALDRVSFATNWLAEAEHGGFYQALVDGTYAHYGLDVKIIPGGPQANNQLLLAAGRVDFYLGANMIQALHAVEQGIPTLVVASLFQKDPIVLMSDYAPAFAKASRDAGSVLPTPQAPLPARIAGNRTGNALRVGGNGGVHRIIIWRCQGLFSGL